MNPTRIVALGDSLTAGHIGGTMWSPSYEPYTQILEQRLGPEVTIINHGVDGDLTSGMVVRYLRNVVPLEPDTVLLLGGTNDLGWGHTYEVILSNLMKIVDHCQTAGTQILVGSIPPIAGIPSATTKRLDFNPMLEEACQQRNVPYVDLFAPLADEDNALRPEYSSDGLHLNQTGYAQMGEVFHEALLTHSSLK